MTRQEHLAWCKRRALEYADQGELPDAVASMLSDLGKHPETGLSGGNAYLAMIGMMTAQEGDKAGVQRWINGFN